MKPKTPFHVALAEVDRRSMLTYLRGMALALVAQGLFPPLVRASTPPDKTKAGSDVMDEALDLLSRYGPEYGGGLSNHAPMACEALVALGRPDAVLPWIELYRNRLQEPPGKTNPISTAGWQEALGDVRRVGDWIIFFERELVEGPWKSVLTSWLPRLAPGLFGAATHCVIRTAHATRRLADSRTPQRLRELAQGLGYWAARYQVLPGTASGGGKLGVAQAMPLVELLPDNLRHRGGLITQEVLDLEDFPAFENVINLVDPKRGEPDFLSQLTRVFADVYLRYNGGFAFIHAVTGPSALRLLSPYLETAARRPASLYAWQAAAGIYARYARTKFEPTGRYANPTPEDLIDRAVSNGSAHAIKFTEVCLREHELNPQTVYLAAALDSTERLRPLRS